MLGLVSFFLFAGYTLIYAAVADGGRFAATPWEALRRDAYQGAADGASAGGQPHESTWDQIIKAGNFLTNPIAGIGGLFLP